MKSPKKDTKRKIAAFIALFLAFLMILGAIAPFISAAEVPSEVSVSAQVGYSGLYKVGYPTPVRAEVKTGASSFDGEVLIRVPVTNSYANSYSYGGEENYIEYAYPLKMSENEVRIVELELTINTIPQYGGIKAEMVDKKGNTVATSSLTFTAYDPENVLVGILSDSPAGLSHIKGICLDEMMKNYSTKSIPNLNADNFPDSLGELNAFNILYINDFDTDRLTNMSKEALKSWVNAGGVLCIGSGENYAKNLKGLSGIINIEKTEHVVTKELDELFLSFDQYLYDNRVEQDSPNNENNESQNKEQSKENDNRTDVEQTKEDEETDDNKYLSAFPDEKMAANPIVFEFPILGKTDNAINSILYSAINTGMGKIVLFPFNLSEAAVQKSPRFQAFLKAVFTMEIAPMVNDGYLVSSPGGSAIVNPYNLSTIPYQKDVSMRIISGLVTLYLFAVGPVLFFILRKKDKKEAGFIIIPVIALTLTCIIFVMSLNTIYKRPVVNEVAAINITSGERYAVKNSNVAVLTGKKGDVAIRLDGYGLSLSPAVGNNYGYGYYYYNEFKPVKVIYGDQPGITYFDNERWSSNVFGVTEEIDLQGEITADIVLKNGAYEGIITNNTPYDLKEVVISGSRGYKKIEDIAAGTNFILNEDFQDKESVFYDMYSLLWGYGSYPDPQERDADQIDGWRKTMYRYIVENNYNNRTNQYYSSFRSSYPAYTPTNARDITIYAYVSENMGQVNATISGASPISFHNNAIIMDVECSLILDRSAYELPFGFVVFSEIRAKDYYDANMDYGIYTNMNNEMEFVYDLSEYEGLSSFMFSSELENNIYGERVFVEIYNCESEKWEDLNYKEYSDAQDYISEKAELIIRIDCTKLDHVNFPEIMLKGGVR